MKSNVNWVLAALLVLLTQVALAVGLASAAEDLEEDATPIATSTTTVPRTTTTAPPTTAPPPASGVLPDVMGMPYGTARSLINELDLGIAFERVDYPASKEEEFGTITALEPPAGSEVRRGETVRLVVGTRPKPMLEDAEQIPWSEIEWVDASAVWQPGQCANWFKTESVGLVLDRVDCSAAHAFELAGKPSLNVDGEIDDDSIGRAARDVCEQVFEDYVGLSVSRSGLQLRVVRPSLETWRDGDRTAVCLLTWPTSKSVIGSAEGALW